MVTKVKSLEIGNIGNYAMIGKLKGHMTKYLTYLKICLY